MLYSLPSTAGYQLAGLRNLLLAPWSGAASFSYASPACAHITTFSGLSGWEIIPCDEGLTDAGQTVASGKLGTTTAQLVQVSLAGLSPERRTAALALVAAGPVVALGQDMRGTWWLYGQELGLRAGGYTEKDTALVLALAGTQPAPARSVNAGRVALLYNASTVFHYPA